MPAPSEPESRFGFPLDAELAREVRSTIERLRRDPADQAHVASLIEVALKLTDAGLREYYLRPLEQARAGTLSLGTARVGISTARRGIAVIVNKLLGGMKPAQLESIANSMEDFLLELEEEELEEEES